MPVGARHCRIMVEVEVCFVSFSQTGLILYNLLRSTLEMLKMELRGRGG